MSPSKLRLKVRARFSIGLGWMSAVLAAIVSVSPRASAQFLRLGPFDIDIVAGADAIYSSNVEQVRPSETDKDLEDYYVVGRLTLNANADLGKHIKVGSGFTLEEEKHFVRTDLDDRARSDPFANANLTTDIEFGRYILALSYRHDSTYEYKQGQFIEGPRKQRTYRRTDDYGGRLTWQRGRLRWFASAFAGRDRYIEDEYKDGDEDRQEMDFGVAWQTTKRIRSTYSYRRSRKKLVNQPDSFDGWDHNQSIGMTFRLLDNPLLTYGLAMEEESSQGEEIGWEPSHTFDVSETLDITKTMKLTGNANYNIKETRGANDVKLTYGADLAHEISRTARQSLRASREPADTFGSTIDTDSTIYGYTFSKQDLFIYNLVLTLGVEYRDDKPLGDGAGERERSWDYVGSLVWTRRVSRKMQRLVGYNYNLQKSDLVDEDMTEHRVTVSYVYTF